MSKVDVFFEQKARNFTTGKLSQIGEIMEFPCIVGMGVRQVTFASLQELNDAMCVYRASLRQNGYSHTLVKSEYQKPLENGVTYALVDIVHYNHDGIEIAHLPASYFIELGTQDTPVVQKVEFLEDPFSALQHDISYA